MNCANNMTDYLHAKDLVIRPFAMGDQMLVTEFFANLGEEGTFFFNGDGINEKPAMAWFEGKSREHSYFLAELDGKMLGFLVFYDYHWKTPWLGIALREDAKGMHLGTRLMAFAESYAREHGKGAIILTTHKDNVRGQALYKKSGYTYLGIHTTGELLYIRYFEDK